MLIDQMAIPTVGAQVPPTTVWMHILTVTVSLRDHVGVSVRRDV